MAGENSVSDTRPPRRANSFDVAERAGVSQSTVSRALAGSPAITEVTRNRVLEAARALDYHVDERAARLRRGTSGVIALVVIRRPGDDPTEAVNSFSYRLIAAVCAAAAEQGYETLVSLQDEVERFDASYVATGQADAMIVIGTTSNREAWSFFEQSAPARVAFWGAPFSHPARVVSDNRAGGRLAGQLLLQNGYRKIVLIGDDNDLQRQFADRLSGCREAICEAGLKLEATLTGAGKDRYEQGRHAVLELIRNDVTFDAIFAACDDIALGALAELSERGIKVPEDVGVVGFDGAAAGATAQPPLTTINPDVMLAGTLLVKIGLGLPVDPEPSIVPVKIVPRRSAIRSDA